MTAETSPDHPLSPENPPKKTGLRSFSLGTEVKSSKIDLDKLDQKGLLELHAKVESRLVGMRLSDVNLEKETLLQFHRAKMLQEDANKSGTEVPMNQRAQVQNSLGNLLTTLAKMQMDLHDSESIKRMKAAVIKVMKEQDKAVQDRFFELLELEFERVETEMAQVEALPVVEEPEQAA
jgi:hypothetical protein